MKHRGKNIKLGSASKLSKPDLIKPVPRCEWSELNRKVCSRGVGSDISFFLGASNLLLDDFQGPWQQILLAWVHYFAIKHAHCSRSLTKNFWRNTRLEAKRSETWNRFNVLAKYHTSWVFVSALPTEFFKRPTEMSFPKFGQVSEYSSAWLTAVSKCFIACCRGPSVTFEKSGFNIGLFSIYLGTRLRTWAFSENDMIFCCF